MASIFSKSTFWLGFVTAMYVIPLSIAAISYYLDKDENPEANLDYPKEVFSLGNMAMTLTFGVIILVTAGFVDRMSSGSDKMSSV